MQRNSVTGGSTEYPDPCIQTHSSSAVGPSGKPGITSPTLHAISLPSSVFVGYPDLLPYARTHVWRQSSNRRSVHRRVTLVYLPTTRLSLLATVPRPFSLLDRFEISRETLRKRTALAVCRRDADAALRSVMVDCMHEKNIQNRGL